MQEGRVTHIMLIHAISHLRISRMDVEEFLKWILIFCAYVASQHKSKYELNRIIKYEIFIHSIQVFFSQVTMKMEKCTLVWIYTHFLDDNLLTMLQSGHLDVVVPPDILNALESSGDESVTNEGGNVQLLCQATGVPEPRLIPQSLLFLFSLLLLLAIFCTSMI